MVNLPTVIVFALLAFGCEHAIASSTNDTELTEQLFLDLSTKDVLNDTAWIPVVEPWASQYVDAIRNGRFGDAIWARYYIAGDVHNGIIEGTTNTTVLQSIEEDAMEYRMGMPDDYTQALSFYAKTSTQDAHIDVIEIPSHIGHEDITSL